MGRARSVGVFGLGLVAGALVGGALALALAPRAGRETREQVRRAADEALGKVRGALDEGRQAVQESRSALRRAVEAGRGVLRRAHEEVETAAPVA
ncbi:MAG TPA: YtxH domain-containing protein [Candidatus Methylomirabilis sp.]|nr:YtxH domain-containing protein [Candidatus Methylomirabilis sp.]